MKSKDENIVMTGWTTVSYKQDAVDMIQKLLDKGLIACGQISGPIESHYKWKGKITTDNEWRVVLKYSKKNEKKMLKNIQQLHPYEVPQWASVGIESTAEYAKWVNQS